MRKPHVTTKRVLGAVLAAGLAATAVVSLATNASAATVPTMTLTPASGATVGGDTIAIKGKALADSDGNSVVRAVYFSTAACADGTPASAAGYVTLGAGAAALTVVTATKATLIIPTVTLPAGTGYICLADATGSSASVLGSAKYLVGVKPTLTSINGVVTATTTVYNASTFGGVALTFAGTGFTKKTLVSVGGTKAVTKFVSDVKVTATVPAGTAGTLKAIKVTSEFGSVTSAGHTVTYLGVAKISPAAGLASTAVGITLTGTGFNAMSFGTGDNQYAIQFSVGGTPVAVADTISTTSICTNINVESDTSLTCQTPNNLTGAYSVQILKHGTTAGSDQAKVAVGGITTVVSRSATYTAAAF